MQKNERFNPQFTEVSAYYDRLMSTVPYTMWVDYVELLLRIEDYHPQQILDCACGTGNVTFELARRGYAVDGTDLSRGMLDVAERKGSQSGWRDVRFFHQDLRSLSLPREYDLAVCLYDSLNYITKPDELKSAFARVADCLLPRSLFIFDLNSELALEAELFTQNNLWRRDSDLIYDWKSRFDPITRLSQVEMYFKVRHADGSEREFHELHQERAYTLDEVRDLLAEAGWQTLRVYDAYTTNHPHAASERWFFVARLT
jgi:ubiquinone/menaquinone biosynthesis C-methylase UbiE